MLRYAGLCASGNCLGPKRCKDIPNEGSYIEILCPVCEGLSCEECNPEGKIKITCCPLEIITDDVLEVIEYADLFEKGLPPVAGGVLNQAKIFVEAARYIMDEKRYWKKKLGLI